MNWLKVLVCLCMLIGGFFHHYETIEKASASGDRNLVNLFSARQEEGRDSEAIRYQQKLYGTRSKAKIAEIVEREGKRQGRANVPAVYEVEPNDVREKADWAQANKANYGKIQKAGDQDFWKFKSVSNAKVSIHLKQIPAGQDFDIYLYDDNGRELAASQKNGSDDEQINEIGLIKGAWYYIFIRGKGNSFHKNQYYNMTFNYFATDEAIDPDDFEPNDSFQHAKNISNSQSIKGNIHHLSDVDYYLLDVGLTSTVELSLGGAPQGIDVDLFLYDKNFKQVSQSMNSKNQQDKIIFNADPGRYYVKVSINKRSIIGEHSYQLSAQVNTIPVILIPGIGGSRLIGEEKFTNGVIGESTAIQEVWLNLGDTVLNPTDSIHRKFLTLKPKAANSQQVIQNNNDTIVYPEQDDGGFRAIDYLTYHLFGKNKSEQYHGMTEHLQKMGYEKNKTLFAFPYDWRLNNSDNAKLLQKKIDQALASSNAKQVQLVVHSMGGLVAKEALLDKVAYQTKTKRIIYMGTPFLGSPKAYQTLKFGYNFGISWGFYDLLEEETGKVIAKFSPAVYQLLPSKVYVNKQSYLNLMADGSRRPFSYDEILHDNRIKLDYKPLIKLAEMLHSKWDNKTLGLPQYRIIGDGQLTLMGYDVDQLSARNIPFYNKKGDGTVPMVSAEHVVGKEKVKKYYVSEEHATLPRNPYVIQQVAHLLLGLDDVQKGMRSQPKERVSASYYLIYRKDGKFPEINLNINGEQISISNDRNVQELPENLRLEKHGNIIVVSTKEQSDSLKVETTQLKKSASYEDSGVVIEEVNITSDDDKPTTVRQIHMLPFKRITLTSGE